MREEREDNYNCCLLLTALSVSSIYKYLIMIMTRVQSQIHANQLFTSCVAAFFRLAKMRALLADLMTGSTKE